MQAFSSAEWQTHVKQALSHWHDPLALAASPLATLLVHPPQSEARQIAQTVRQRLRTCIEQLRPIDERLAENDLRWLDRPWRPYAILTLRYVQDKPRHWVQQTIGLAEGGQYYKEQKKAIALLSTLLQQQVGTPIDTPSPAPLAYPSGAVRLNDRFYVERKADADLRYALAQAGQTITIRGARQVGKTSLLVRGVQQSRETKQAHVVYIDLQEVDPSFLSSYDAFLHMLAEWIVDELELDPDCVERVWRSRLGAARKLRRLIERELLPKLDGTLLFAFDEIDRLLLTDFYNNFFALLRSWHNLRSRSAIWERVTIIMAISTEPYLLIDDLHQSPFNVGERIFVDDFLPAESAELNKRHQSPLSSAELEQLHQLLNGHPFLTRVAFYTIVRDRLRWPQFTRLVASAQTPFLGHLQHIDLLLQRDARLMDGFGRILHNQPINDEHTRFRLLKSGLIKDDRVRCDLYQQHFVKRMNFER